ncbi:MAG: ABC transporter permease [Ignisphaera sp.]|uniref:ABC transporter permease n=1 Tax=Ignisphaera aggregans TaxID=334771 RepID=A0A7C4JIA6_9CREN
MEITETKKLLFIALRDLERFINSKYWLAGQIAMNLADIFIFALVLRGFIRREFVPDYLQYMAPGAVALATFVASFSIGREVGMEVRREIVDYLLTLPVKRTTLVFGRIFSGMLRGLIYQLPFIVIVMLLVSPPTIHKVPLLILTSVILTITMSSLAIAVSTISRDFNIQATFRAVTYYLLFFFSNVFYTKKVLELRFPQPLPDIITLTPISLSADIYRWCFNYYAKLEIEKLLLLIVWGLTLTTLAATIYLRNLTKR